MLILNPLMKLNTKPWIDPRTKSYENLLYIYNPFSLLIAEKKTLRTSVIHQQHFFQQTKCIKMSTNYFPRVS